MTNSPASESQPDYSNAAAIMTITPALPAYTELSDEAAPMKFVGIVEEGVALALALALAMALALSRTVGAVVGKDPVPIAVGPAVVVLCAE